MWTISALVGLISPSRSRPSRSRSARFSAFRLSKELVAVNRMVSVLGTRTLKLPWWLMEMAPTRTRKFAPSTTACLSVGWLMVTGTSFGHQRPCPWEVLTFSDQLISPSYRKIVKRVASGSLILIDGRNSRRFGGGEANRGTDIRTNFKDAALSHFHGSGFRAAPLAHVAPSRAMDPRCAGL